MSTEGYDVPGFELIWQDLLNLLDLAVAVMHEAYDSDAIRQVLQDHTKAKVK